MKPCTQEFEEFGTQALAGDDCWICSVFDRDESGVQLVEIAIVIPILLDDVCSDRGVWTLLLRIHDAAKAARVGSRYLCTAPTVAAEDAIREENRGLRKLAGTGSPILTGL